jgi:hypothetical protein
MLYKAKVAVCSEFHINHSTQREYHVECFKVNLVVQYVKKQLGFKRLTGYAYAILITKV